MLVQVYTPWMRQGGLVKLGHAMGALGSQRSRGVVLHGLGRLQDLHGAS